jgi:hypothetical protein
MHLTKAKRREVRTRDVHQIALKIEEFETNETSVSSPPNSNSLDEEQEWKSFPFLPRRKSVL